MTPLTDEERRVLVEFCSPIISVTHTLWYTFDNDEVIQEDDWLPDDEMSPAWQAQLCMDAVAKQSLEFQMAVVINIGKHCNGKLQAVFSYIHAPNSVKMKAIVDVLRVTE